MKVVSRAPVRPTTRPVLVTGGCGFIGCNLVHALAARGERVLVLDSLARPGAERNARWLKALHPAAIEFRRADMRDERAVRAAVASARAVLHLAAQVAVTTSLEDPAQDFAINAGGAVVLLEAVRRLNPQSPVLFASTNKVYGRLFGAGDVKAAGKRCAPVGAGYAHGVSEDTPLDFHSPYGCSKGAADQYVRDYARVFGLRTAVLRMSCVYGPRQFGNEDQGWLAHFALKTLRGEPITIYGPGRQVRDVLFVDDAVAAWLAALERIDAVAGRVFNLGGGPANTVSLLEAIDMLAAIHGAAPVVRLAPARPGDQPWYVSDTRAFAAALGWRPRTAPGEGMRALYGWLAAAVARPAPPAQEVHA